LGDEDEWWRHVIADSENLNKRTTGWSRDERFSAEVLLAILEEDMKGYTQLTRKTSQKKHKTESKNERDLQSYTQHINNRESDITLTNPDELEFSSKGNDQSRGALPFSFNEENLAIYRLHQLKMTQNESSSEDEKEERREIVGRKPMKRNGSPTNEPTVRMIYNKETFALELAKPISKSEWLKMIRWALYQLPKAEGTPENVFQVIEENGWKELKHGTARNAQLVKHQIESLLQENFSNKKEPGYDSIYSLPNNKGLRA